MDRDSIITAAAKRLERELAEIDRREQAELLQSIANEFYKATGEPLYDDTLALQLLLACRSNEDAKADIQGTPYTPDAVVVTAVVNALRAIYCLDVIA